MGQRDHPLAPRRRLAGGQAPRPARPIWRTGRTAATGSRPRWSSPTAGTRSPPRRPPAPSATTSPATRYAAAGTRRILEGRARPRAVRWMSCASTRSSQSTSTTGISPCAVVAPDGNSSAPRPPSPSTWPGCRPPRATGTSRAAISASSRLAREHALPGDRDRGPGLRRGPRGGTRAPREPARRAARGRGGLPPRRRGHPDRAGSATGWSRWPPTRACRHRHRPCLYVLTELTTVG